MLIALNEENQSIYADTLKSERQLKNHYHCPDCRECVFLKKGSLKIAHFSHFSQSKCHSFSESETKEHLQGKQLLYEWFTKQGLVCQLEAYLPNLNQRPDILVWVSQIKAIAIEFQCSSLSLKRMRERTNGYKEKGYDVFWILGSQFRLTERITAFQRSFIYSNKQVTMTLFSLDVLKKTVCLYSNIQQQSTTQRIIYNSHLIKIDQFKLSDIPGLIEKLSNKSKSKSKRNLFQPEELIRSHEFLNQGRMYQTPEIVLFQKYIYRKGDSLISIPIEVYFNVPGQMMVKTLPYLWKYILLKWISENQINALITVEKLDNQINKIIDIGTVTFHHMPLLTLEEQKKPLYSYVQLLIKAAILEENDYGELVLKKKPYYYKNEQEKLTSFSNSFFLTN